MAQDYDKIFKENVGLFFLALSDRYLGIKIAQSEELKDKMQTTLEKEADFLRKIKTPEGEVFILHLEFQVKDEVMIHRMQTYFSVLREKYKLPIRQFVIYVGEKAPNMKTKPEPEDVFTGFELMDLHGVDYESLLLSEIPEEIVLAILGDFKNDKAELVLQKIISRLQKLSQSPNAFSKYIRQLTVLSRLRNLVNLTQKQLRDMAITYDVEKDYFFVEGKKEGKKDVILNMLKDGSFSIEKIAEITSLSVEQIIEIKKEVEK